MAQSASDPWGMLGGLSKPLLNPIHDIARCYSGADDLQATQPNMRVVSSDAFDEALREYELELQWQADESQEAHAHDEEGQEENDENDDREV
ncbi:hypothetical protein BU15DRAFT_71128 [Melanogaster broomeanus]|nr:hypothetical protein BU15DRAFT_71128 [Melanogaster broomeanus]